MLYEAHWWAGRVEQAALAEGIDSRELTSILRRQARSSLYLDRMVAPMLAPSEAELGTSIARSDAVPRRPFEEVEVLLRRWYVGKADAGTGFLLPERQVTRGHHDSSSSLSQPRPMSGHGDSKKAVVAAMAANAGIAIAKFAAAVFTGSITMLAEGVHSVADTANQGSCSSASSCRRDDPERYPLGARRKRYFWAFIVALMLFFPGRRLRHLRGIHGRAP
jgi:hypothetical protein